MGKNVHVFPSLKRYDIQIDENTTNQEIDILTNHYMDQIIKTFENHGFEVNKRFLSDLKYVEDYMKSAMLRNIGKYHVCQDYIDDIEEYVDIEKD